MSKKYFRPAVRILKRSKSFKILLIERAVGFLPPAHTPPLLCPGHLLRGFLTVSTALTAREGGSFFIWLYLASFKGRYRR